MSLIYSYVYMEKEKGKKENEWGFRFIRCYDRDMVMVAVERWGITVKDLRDRLYEKRRESHTASRVEIKPPTFLIQLGGHKTTPQYYTEW